MFTALHKRLLWIIVIWFAVLQTISPFIHVHIEADSPAQGHGLHVHDQGLLQMTSGKHTFNTHAVHTIGLNDALVKSADALPLPFFALLFIIYLSNAVVRFYGVDSVRLLSPKFHSGSLSRPRAPPLF